MIRNNFQGEQATALAVADFMMTAISTAPKACGTDKITALCLDGPAKDDLSKKMREIGEKIGQDFFIRDAANVDSSHCVVIAGVKDIPLAMDDCGLCGFENCTECKKAGSHCSFNVTDLGIAIGSAASIAADNRLDNRVMYSAGKAALEMNIFPKNVRICFAIPLSTSSKSIFFDRDVESLIR